MSRRSLKFCHGNYILMIDCITTIYYLLGIDDSIQYFVSISIFYTTLYFVVLPKIRCQILYTFAALYACSVACVCVSLLDIFRIHLFAEHTMTQRYWNNMSASALKMKRESTVLSTRYGNTKY